MRRTGALLVVSACEDVPVPLDLIARPVQPGDLILSQAPTKRARVLLGLSSCFRAGNRQCSLGDEPVEGYLGVSLASVLLSDVGDGV